MIREKIIQIIVVLLIQAVSICIHLAFIGYNCNMYIPALVLCSLIGKKIYKNSMFWRAYFNILKFPVYVFTLILELFISFLLIVCVQYLSVVILFIFYYFVYKYSFVLLGFKLDSQLFLYFALVSVSILFSLKKTEIRVKEGFNKGKDMAKISRIKIDANPISMYFYRVTSLAYFFRPLFSSEIMRYSIYLFNFTIIIISNIIPYTNAEIWLKELAASQTVNGAVLTFLAFDNLYNNRRILDNISSKKMKTIISIVKHRSKQAVYGVRYTTDNK